MCYAIPAKILEIEGDNAAVDYGGVRKKANISLMNKIAAGDYILVHAGFAIEKLEKKSAEESLQLIREYIAKTEKGEKG